MKGPRTQLEVDLGGSSRISNKKMPVRVPRLGAKDKARMPTEIKKLTMRSNVKMVSWIC